jgi:hypothetical protein
MCTGIGDGVMATNCEIALFAGTAGIAAPFQTPPVSNSFAAGWNANRLRFDDVSEGHLNERVGTPSQQGRSRRATRILRSAVEHCVGRRFVWHMTNRSRVTPYPRREACAVRQEW